MEQSKANQPHAEIKKVLKRLKTQIDRLDARIEKGGDVSRITERFREIEVEFSELKGLLGEGFSAAESVVAGLDEKKREKWMSEIAELGGETLEGYRRIIEKVTTRREDSLEKLGVIRQARGVLDSFFKANENKEPRFFDRKG